MTGKAVFTFADYDGEKSSMSFNTANVNAGNIATISTALDTLKSDVEAVTLGLPVKDVRQYADTGAGSGSATDPVAQRESKWLVSYTDDVTGKGYRLEIPCADLNVNTLGAGGLWNSSDTLWTDFVTSFEAVVVSPDGNAVTVESVRHVGRNL